MNTLMDWCNTNNGFLTALLSLLTLVVSIIAIIVAVRTARLPYKKKLLIEVGDYVSDVGLGIHVTVTNIGNRDVVLTLVGLKFGNQNCINQQTHTKSQVRLLQGEATAQYFSFDMLKSGLSRFEDSSKEKVYGYVRDTEGEEYKKYIGTVEYFKRHINS